MRTKKYDQCIYMEYVYLKKYLIFKIIIYNLFKIYEQIYSKYIVEIYLEWKT